MSDDNENGLPPEPESPGVRPAAHRGDDSLAARAGSVAVRVAAFVGAALLTGLGVWTLQRGFGYAGSTPVALGILAVAAVVLLGAVWLIAVALVGPPGRGRPRGAAALEAQAERLGLPDDPHAYLDGGIGVAATAQTVSEADVIAAHLNGCGIAAWVDQAYASGWLSHAQFALNPTGVRVLVPLGRLADAQQALAQRHPIEGDTEDEDEEPQPAPGGQKRPLAKRFCGGVLLLVGIGYVATSALVATAVAELGGIASIALAAVVFLPGLGLCAAGILGLRARDKARN